MNDFVPRIEPVASVVSAQERGSAAIRSAAATVTSSARAAPAVRNDAGQGEKASSAASYARVKADIAETIAKMRQEQASGTKDAAANADRSLIALMPDPVVVLPMPPTDQDMIEFVAGVAQAVMQQAAQSRVAQARVPSGAVDAVVS